MLPFSLQKYSAALFHSQFHFPCTLPHYTLPLPLQPALEGLHCYQIISYQRMEKNSALAIWIPDHFLCNQPWKVSTDTRTLPMNGENPALAIWIPGCMSLHLGISHHEFESLKITLNFMHLLCTTVQTIRQLAKFYLVLIFNS